MVLIGSSSLESRMYHSASLPLSQPLSKFIGMCREGLGGEVIRKKKAGLLYVGS